MSTGSEWTFELIETYDRGHSRIAAGEYGLDTYPNQLEIISAEQMMDAYSSVGMPVNYHHWSFGKQFVATEKLQGAARWAWLTRSSSTQPPAFRLSDGRNTMTMVALVIAHAAYGHNSFFQGQLSVPHLDRRPAIIDYLVFARDYLSQCEERYGFDAVEMLLDSCHALMNYGVDRYKRPAKLSLAQEKLRQREREEHQQLQINDLWRTIPRRQTNGEDSEPARFPAEPQENPLYFIEKSAPLLEPWQREVVRIAQGGAVFYPQRQTQVMNEGWPPSGITPAEPAIRKRPVHRRLYGGVLQSHTNVVKIAAAGDQPLVLRHQPHALGFAISGHPPHLPRRPPPKTANGFRILPAGPLVPTLDFAACATSGRELYFGFANTCRQARCAIACLPCARRRPRRQTHALAIHDESGYRQSGQTLVEQ